MTIQDAKKLNKGDKIRVILDGVIIDTKVHSTSISEVGVTIWFYDWDGTFLSTSSENVFYIGPNKITKEDKFIEWLDTVKETVKDNSYFYATIEIIKEKFKEIFHE